jgi:transcriptional regulator with XRE-family HTH domain
VNTERKIKMLLAALGVSQSELARKMGDSPQNLGVKIKRNTANPEYLQKVADALGVKFIYYFELPDGTRI